MVGLTTSQSARINTVFEEFLKPQRERWTSLGAIERQLDELLGQAHPDERLVIDRITALENRRSEMNRSRLVMLFHIQQVLSLTQRSKLQELGWAAFPATAERNPKTAR
jgi:Spy/CpxP family protein refolding chaperone